MGLRPFWAGSAGFDVGVNTVVAGTPAYVSVLGNYTESATNPGDYGTDDYVLLRGFGFIKADAYSSSGSTCVWLHQGFTVIDSDRTGGIDETVAAIDITNSADTRRWLWSRHMPFFCSTASPFTDPESRNSDQVLPLGSWVDFSPKVRIRSNQRLILVTACTSDGAAGAEVRYVSGMRYLLGKQR